MDLDSIPRKQTAEITGGQPPKPPRTQRPSKGPINRRPGVVYDVCGVMRGRSARNQSVRMKAQIFGPVFEQEVERPQQHEQQNTELHARRTPSPLPDQPALPRQDRDRPDADTGEGDAERKPAPADKPVRQINRL